MKIQTKLAAVLSLMVAISVGACCLAFVQRQRAALRRAEAEKEQVLLGSVQKVAGESLLANDPLMLISYLTYLRRDKPEVAGCRLLLDGEWQKVKGPDAPQDGEIAARLVEAALPDGRAQKVEVSVSSRLLLARERKEFEAMLRDVGRIAAAAIVLGVLLSILLSHTMTRRLARIETALEAIGEGRFDQTVGVSDGDEIGRLSRGVDAMSRKLAELEEMKKLLVASVSHELRSPLGAIESLVREMLSQPQALPPNASSSLQSIRSYAARLEHFVSSMLEMSKIERGRLEFVPRTAELGPVVEDAVAFFSQRAKDAGLTLAADVEPGLPAFDFDPDLIAQVLANLISNALKFTPSGGKVTAGARKTAQGIVVFVQDTGVGIPAEALSRIFAPFERVPNALRASGTGLGLAISKAIIERHGGRVGVESQPGRGSRFYFELPFKAPAASRQ